MSYKSDTTLNERDSLTDIFLTLKYLLNVYSVALSNGTSKGFLEMVKEKISAIEKSRLNIFMNLTERDYMGVNSCDQERLKELIDRFSKRVNTLN